MHRLFKYCCKFSRAGELWRRLENECKGREGCRASVVRNSNRLRFGSGGVGSVECRMQYYCSVGSS